MGATIDSRPQIVYRESRYRNLLITIAAGNWRSRRRLREHPAPTAPFAGEPAYPGLNGELVNRIREQF